MLEFTLTVDHDIIVAYAELIDDVPRAVNAFVENTIANDVRQQVQAVNQYPPAAVHPIEWTSEKQRRYVMGFVLARDSKGDIIPYERKGTYWDSYIVAWDADTGMLSVTSDNPIDQFVTGPFQQQFHANTGWPVVEDEYLNILLNAQDNLIEGYIDIVDIKSLI